jgi:hypothetical protein
LPTFLVSIGLEKTPALFGIRQYEPIFNAGPKNTIGTAIEIIGEDALIIESSRKKVMP